MQFHVKTTFWWLIQHGFARDLEQALGLGFGTLPDGALND